MSELRVTRRELVTYRAHGLRVDGDADTVALRVRRIRRLRRDLGLSYDIIAIVLPLVERVERLEDYLAGKRGTSPAR
jgi:hypothetical protein